MCSTSLEHELFPFGLQKRMICIPPGAATRRALREFADWQRASAQLRRHEPTEILAFGRLTDFFQALPRSGMSDDM